MTYKIGDRVRQTSTTSGTGSLTLIAPSTGFNSFVGEIGDGNTCPYLIDDGAGNSEEGIGTVSAAGPTLARTTVIKSTNANALVNFSGAVKTVACVLSAATTAFLDANGVPQGKVARNDASQTLTGNQTITGTLTAVSTTSGGGQPGPVMTSVVQNASLANNGTVNIITLAQGQMQRIEALHYPGSGAIANYDFATVIWDGATMSFLGRQTGGAGVALQSGGGGIVQAKNTTGGTITMNCKTY